MNSIRLRTLDLFCGGGGSSWGARDAGAEIVCGVDAWDLATETYRFNFPSALSINYTLDEDSGSGMLGELGGIDLLLASPECTNHTCAKGNRPRDENSKRTARYLLNFARELNPRWMVLENVTQMRNWHGYDPLIDEIKGLGYNVLPQVLDAVDFGVPQKRKRLFLLCDRKAVPLEIPVASIPPKPAYDILDKEGTWGCSPLENGRRARPTLERAKRAIASLGEGVPFLLVYYGSDGAGGWQKLDRPLRSLTTLDRFALVTWQGGTPMMRMLQPSELRRAMGLGGDYVMPFGVRRDKIKLLGNGVCPPVMKAIVQSLVQGGTNTQAVNPSNSTKVAKDTSRPIIVPIALSNVVHSKSMGSGSNQSEQRKLSPYLKERLEQVKQIARTKPLRTSELLSMVIL